LPARRLLDRLRAIAIDDSGVPEAARLLLSWDCVLDRESGPAALFEVWLSRLIDLAVRPRVPERLWPIYSVRSPVETLLELLESPDARFGANPREACDRLMLAALSEAVDELAGLLGADQERWSWGRLHRAHFRHMLSSAAASEEVKQLLDLGSISRGGDGNTPLATAGPSFDQVHGASYAHVLDLSDWDRSLAINTPGQSGQPGSNFYGNLVEPWAEGAYLPLTFSRGAVEAVTQDRLRLVPA
jgi:penicillin amidase